MPETVVSVPLSVPETLVSCRRHWCRAGDGGFHAGDGGVRAAVRVGDVGVVPETVVSMPETVVSVPLSVPETLESCRRRWCRAGDGGVHAGDGGVRAGDSGVLASVRAGDSGVRAAVRAGDVGVHAGDGGVRAGVCAETVVSMPEAVVFVPVSVPEMLVSVPEAVVFVTEPLGSVPVSVPETLVSMPETVVFVPVSVPEAVVFVPEAVVFVPEAVVFVPVSVPEAVVSMPETVVSMPETVVFVPVSVPESLCCWDQDDQKGVYSCPQCRQSFNTRPVLGKNTMLAEVVENLRKRKLQNDQLDHYYTEPGDVECDVCTGDKNKAIKSCLVCLESYCQTHFERHEEFHSRKRHKMTDAIERLQEMICPLHDRLLEMFCRTDQICVCMLCMANEHKTHDTVSPVEERTEKQNHLEETKINFQQRIEERQKELKELREAVESHKRSAQAAVEDSERIFTELIRSIERSRSEVTQLIRDQEKILISQTEVLLKRLEQEIEDLRRRDTELEQLSHTEHHIHFLQSFQSLSVPPGSTDSSSVSSRLSFDDLRTFVSQLQEKLQHAFKEEKENLCRIVRYIEVIPTPEYDSRNEFLQYVIRNTAVIWSHQSSAVKSEPLKKQWLSFVFEAICPKD
ncbi:unnamed protein product [Leuciscus chuanchicus]